MASQAVYASLRWASLPNKTKERTAAEYEELFSRAGLRLTRIVPTKSPYSVIEAVAA